MINLDIKRMREKDEAHDYIKRMLGFPEYYGTKDDKAFVGWRILKDPPSTDGFIRLTFWIDRRTKRIVHSGTEIHEDR